MSTVTEIKEAIDRLSPRERSELEALLHPRLDDEWDSDTAPPVAAMKRPEGVRPKKRAA